MDAITLEFTLEELKELSKLLHIGAFVSLMVGYENLETLRSIGSQISAMGHLYDPGGDTYEPGGPTETAFRLSLSAETQCLAMLDLYVGEQSDIIMSEGLSQRDFEEKHGILDHIEIIKNGLVDEYNNIYDHYLQEISLNGMKNFKLLKMEQ